MSTFLSLLALTQLAQAQALSSDELQLVELINAARAEAGLPALTPDPDLAAVARSHSTDMVQNQYFSHVSPTTGDLGNRLRTSGIPYRQAGENIALDHSVADAHEAFMTSPHHRENVLESEWTHVGVGIVRAGNRIMVTEAFMLARDGVQPAPEATVDRDEEPAAPGPEPAVAPPDGPFPGLLTPPDIMSGDPMPPASEPAPGLPEVTAEMPPEIAMPAPQVSPFPVPGLGGDLPVPDDRTGPPPPAAPSSVPGIWIISEDGSRYRVELGPELLLRLLSAL